MHNAPYYAVCYRELLRLSQEPLSRARQRALETTAAEYRDCSRLDTGRSAHCARTSANVSILGGEVPFSPRAKHRRASARHLSRKFRIDRQRFIGPGVPRVVGASPSFENETVDEPLRLRHA